MGKIRDSNEVMELAKKIYHENKGEVTLKYIAGIVGVSTARISMWKKQYNWEDYTKDQPKVSKAFSSLEKYADSKLNAQQIAFCHNYIRTFNARQALIEAGYSEQNANIVACNLLKDIKIKAYLRKLKKVHDIGDYLSTQMIIDRHKKIAFADMTDFFDENWRPKPMDKVDGSLIKKVIIKSGKTNEFTIELEDRAKSLDFLTKFYALDPDLEIKKKSQKDIIDADDAEVVTIVDDIPKESGGK